MKKLAIVVFALAALSVQAQDESFHRAEQDRVITYWLLDPDTHQFRFSHDFTVTRVGQKYVHSFVRKGSVVSPDAKMIDVDSGKPLKTYAVTGKDVNALDYYPDKLDPESVAVQGDLEHPIAEGQSARVRAQEAYTDPVSYTVKDGELVWARTLGRPVNYVILPPGWMLTSVKRVQKRDARSCRLRSIRMWLARPRHRARLRTRQEQHGAGRGRPDESSPNFWRKSGPHPPALQICESRGRQPLRFSKTSYQSARPASTFSEPRACSLLVFSSAPGPGPSPRQFVLRPGNVRAAVLARAEVLVRLSAAPRFSGMS